MENISKKSNIKTISLALLVMALWGSLFTVVKIGYKAFDISSSSIPDIIMFASMRFIISGLVVCAFSFFRKEKIAAPKTKNIVNIIFVGLFSIVLHYMFTYVGLSTTDSSKTALIKQLGALIYVCFAFLFFKNEKFNDKDLKLIHYKIHWKPWHYDGVLYENHFWDYAKQTSFYEEILDKKLSYTDEEKRRDAIAYERLMQMAIDDAKDPNNYKNLVCK